MVKALVAAGANVNSRGSEKFTPLLAACVIGESVSSAAAVIEHLVENGADVNARYENHDNCLSRLFKTGPRQLTAHDIVDDRAEEEEEEEELRRFVRLVSFLLNVVDVDRAGLTSVLALALKTGHADLAAQVWSKMGRYRAAMRNEGYRRRVLASLLLLPDFPLDMAEEVIEPRRNRVRGRRLDLARPVMWDLLAVTVAATQRSRSHVEFVRRYLRESGRSLPAEPRPGCRQLLDSRGRRLTRFAHPLLAAIENVNYKSALIILRSNTVFSDPPAKNLYFQSSDGRRVAATSVSFVLDHPFHVQKDMIFSSGSTTSSRTS